MAFKPSALKPPGAPLRAKQRNPLVDSEDAELLEASASLDTPRKEGEHAMEPGNAAQNLLWLPPLSLCWFVKSGTDCCRCSASGTSEGLALPARPGPDSDSLLRWERVPEVLLAQGGLGQRPSVPPHHLCLPPGSDCWAHHVRHGLVQHRWAFTEVHRFR